MNAKECKCKYANFGAQRDTKSTSAQKIMSNNRLIETTRFETTPKCGVPDCGGSFPMMVPIFCFAWSLSL